MIRRDRDVRWGSEYGMLYNCIWGSGAPSLWYRAPQSRSKLSELGRDPESKCVVYSGDLRGDPMLEHDQNSELSLIVVYWNRTAAATGTSIRLTNRYAHLTQIPLVGELQVWLLVLVASED